MYYEAEILKAQEFACEHFNVARTEFIELAAKRYPQIQVDTPFFLCAVKTYDQIQNDMKETA